MYLHLLSLMSSLLAEQSQDIEIKRNITPDSNAVLKSEDTAQDCVDSRLRGGKCVALTQCPDMVEEFYDEARKNSFVVDFQTFISNSICGFDGMNFLICCRTRVATPQPSTNPLTSAMIFGASSSSSAATAQAAAPSNVFLFAPLGSYISNIQTTSAPFIYPVATQQPPSAATNNAPPMIYPPVSYPSPQNTNPFVFQSAGQNPLSTSTPPTVFQPMPPAPTQGGIIYQPIPQPLTPIAPMPTITTTTTSAPQTGAGGWDGRCGINRGNTNRVVGGVETRRGTYPWMAALGYRDEFVPSILKFLCGGSLVSAKYVLTSAHCINSNLMLVRLGAHDLSNSAEANAVDYRIARTKLHEAFDLKTIAHDIALIELSPMVTMTNFIAPICLPESSTFLTQDFVGMNPFVAGWGASKHQGITSNVLMDVQVPIVSRQTCEQSYRTVFNFVEISDKVICAGNSNVDACQGDSGGPLMLPQMVGTSYHYFLLGTVSYGYECARSGFPGVYTRVAAYMPWIKQNMI